MCIGFVCFVCFVCLCLFFFTGGCECFLSRALLSGSHYVLHCVTLLCYAPDVEQIKMMMMMMTMALVA